MSDRGEGRPLLTQELSLHGCYTPVFTAFLLLQAPPTAWTSVVCQDGCRRLSQVLLESKDCVISLKPGATVTFTSILFFAFIITFTFIIIFTFIVKTFRERAKACGVCFSRS